MSAFTDGKGRKWNVSLTVGGVRDVRTACKVDLFKVLGGAESEAFADLLWGDVERLVNVLFVLLAEQVEAAKIDGAEFGRGFDGPTVEAAVQAFLDAVTDFFPRSRVAKVLKERMGEVLSRADERIIRDLRALDLSGTFGASPGSPALTPSR